MGSPLTLPPGKRFPEESQLRGKQKAEAQRLSPETLLSPGSSSVWSLSGLVSVGDNLSLKPDRFGWESGLQWKELRLLHKVAKHAQGGQGSLGHCSFPFSPSHCLSLAVHVGFNLLPGSHLLHLFQSFLHPQPPCRNSCHPSVTKVANFSGYHVCGYSLGPGPVSTFFCASGGHFRGLPVCTPGSYAGKLAI